MKRLFSTTILALVLIVMAVAMGFYVYPTRPALVWTLLAVCWMCYRLRLRAEARFGKR